MTKLLTEVQRRALRFLYERDHSGVLDNRGRILARGEISGRDATTWLHLIAAGHLEFSLGRFRLTESGVEIARNTPAEQEPSDAGH